mmetsp:Transcript_32456/g.88054  ORF Transcript_32456/g.88054 Transcript_32456/m.88054 type:complete len:223 (+) Transcript_32456:475-1143(+)
MAWHCVYICCRNASTSFFGTPSRSFSKQITATRSASFWECRAPAKDTSNGSFLSPSTGAWKVMTLRASSNERKSSGLRRLAFSGNVIDSSQGKSYLIRARPLRNCLYSQSCTCKVTGLKLPVLVFTCLRMSGRWPKVLWASFSTLGRKFQKCLLLGPAERFTARLSSFKASLGSSGPPFGSKQRKGACAPMPTSHWLSKSPKPGLARSKQTVIILAQVSPKP